MKIIALRPGGLQATGAIMLLLLANAMPSALAARGEADHEAALRALRARVADLDRELASDRRDQDELRQRIQSSEQELAGAARATREAERALAVQREQVAAAQQARSRALSRVGANRSDLARALRVSYMAGNPGRLQLLFRAGEMTALDRLDADAAAVARALSRRLSDLAATVEQLRLAEQELAGQQAELEKRSGAERAALSALKSAQMQRRRQLDELARRSSDRAAELNQARSEQARLEKLLEGLRRALRDSPNKFERGTPFKSQRGRLPWPLRGPLLAKFGSAKNGGPLTWSGWWIGGAPGEAVRAVADGRAVYVGWVQRYGMVVILDHPGQYLTLYGHVQEAQVEVGETVSAGGLIATAGNSGGHQQSGVYFEIREGSTAIDPRSWLAP